VEASGGGGGGGYHIVPDIIFRASTQMVGTKDYVYAMVSGVVGDLHVSAGMAGDDSTAHSFAQKYEPAAQMIVKGVSSAGEAIGLTASKLLTMAASYLATEDRVAARFTPGIDTSSFAKPPQPECEPQNAAGALPMVTESKQVNEIPIIGEFWPQGDPDKLRAAADVWRRLATLIDDAQHNAEDHARPIPVHCSGEAITAFQEYVKRIWSPCPSGSDVVAGGPPLMENLSAACLQMAKVCTGYADAIDDCRHTLIAIGVGAGIITGIGVALTFFTFGGSDAAAAAGDAALAAEAATAAAALATAEAELAAAAAIVEAEAVITAALARLAAVGAVSAVTVGVTASGASASPVLAGGAAGDAGDGAAVAARAAERHLPAVQPAGPGRRSRLGEHPPGPRPELRQPRRPRLPGTRRRAARTQHCLR
jgi:hypothetical protein